MEQKALGDPNYGGTRVVDKRHTAQAAQEVREEMALHESVREAEAAQMDEILRQQAVNDDSVSVPKPQVMTAFVVIMDHEGNVQAQSDLSVVGGFDVLRAATFSDMYSAACHIQKDISGQEVTHRVMMGLAQQAQAAQQAAMAHKLSAAPSFPPRR